MMLLALLATTAAVSVGPAAPERTAWYTCLEDYAQVAMASTSSPAAIAIQTDRACSAERKAFQVALWRSREVKGDGAALNARFAVEDRAAYGHVIRFVERLR
ncbi:hypothetical protein [Sphingomonas radiodurans]|uniref:hypothetical protein n=1 Tax=Sphingomonas radiodurans TaxID=2890321 RepID=UPI001E3918B3|nr:hypothetical protein [Sphingomonas radiodurans]WBH15360.1 hypothetical protein LLW23_10945 [Sphingomonas radiodurans]